MAEPIQVEVYAPTWVAGSKKLEAFPKQYERAIHRATIRATRLHQRTLRAVTPRKTGRLRRSWVVVGNKPSSGIIVNRQPYAEYVESGTRAHTIYPVRAKALRFKPKGSSKYVFAKKVRHPGTTGQHMTVKAYDRDKARIRNIYRKEIEKELSRL